MTYGTGLERRWELVLIVTYKQSILRIGHACFLSDDDIAKEDYRKKKCDIVYLYGINDTPRDGTYLRTQHTLIKDLKPTEDDIYNSFGKSLRKHIRRSIRDDNINIRIYSPKDLKKNNNVIDICKMLFEKMYASKGKKTAFNERMATALIGCEFLHVSVAYYNNDPIGFCAILVQGTNARRWISAFDFRNNPDMSQKYSDAHKRLDWEVMRYCKRIGVTQIDLGGINSSSEPNGIARFKLEFEKNNVISYKNYIVPTSFKGRTALMYWRLRKLFI